MSRRGADQRAQRGFRQASARREPHEAHLLAHRLEDFVRIIERVAVLEAHADVIGLRRDETLPSQCAADCNDGHNGAGEKNAAG